MPQDHHHVIEMCPVCYTVHRFEEEHGPSIAHYHAKEWDVEHEGWTSHAALCMYHVAPGDPGLFHVFDDTKLIYITKGRFNTAAPQDVIDKYQELAQKFGLVITTLLRKQETVEKMKGQAMEKAEIATENKDTPKKEEGKEVVAPKEETKSEAIPDRKIEQPPDKSDLKPNEVVIDSNVKPPDVIEPDKAPLKPLFFKTTRLGEIK